MLNRRFTHILLIAAILLGSAASSQENLRIRRPPVDKGSQQPSDCQISQCFQAPAMRVTLPKPIEGGASNSKLKGGTEKETHKGDLTEIQLQRLASHDIVLLVDRSWSMGTNDCPAPSTLSDKLPFPFAVCTDETTSRWDWCLTQTSHLAKQTERALANGFTVVLFAGHFDVFPHVNVKQLRSIFADHSPGGSTKLEKPLENTFDEYFNRKKLANGHVKPLVVGIITDGCPTHPEFVRQEIASVTQQMHEPNEITIVFFLIGARDRKGEEFVWDISHNLHSQGAKFNIVKSVPFGDIEHLGLARALAENLQ